MLNANQETMRRFVDEVINNQCLATIDEVIHPDYVFRTPDQELRGKQALKEFLSAYHKSFPDLRVRIDDMVCEGNKAVLVFTLMATHQHAFMGIAATGNQVNINGIICSRIEDGQIIEEWELLDQLSMFRQLGIVSI